MYFADEMFVRGTESQIQSGAAGKQKAWMVILSPKHKIPMHVYSTFTSVLQFSEHLFYQGTVVLFNPVRVLFSVMLPVYKSNVSVAVFKT